MTCNPGGPIWILGTGVYGRAPLPAVLAERLRNVSTVYYRARLDPSTWLPPELSHAHLVCLAGALDQSARLDGFTAVAHAVIAGAQAPTEVAYCTPGSAVVYERPAALIQQMARANGIECHVVPAASCIDAILAFLGEDAAPALQVIDARWLVKSNVEFDARVNILLLQLDAFSTDARPTEADMTMASLIPLREYLLRQRPPDSPAIFVRAPWHSVSDPGYFRGTVVSRLGTLREPSSLQGLSLFLPSLFDPDRVRRRWWEMYVRDVPVARCTRDTTT